MFKIKVLVQITIICLIANLTYGTLITMDIDTSISISDFDPSHTGNELKIDYLIQNTTAGYFDDSLYRIIIPSGALQTIYAVGVPDEWTAVIKSDEVEIYTLNGYKAIQCGESKSFSVFAHAPGLDISEIQAMNSQGQWTAPEAACVPNGQIPEPATIFLLGCGVLIFKRKN